MLVDQYVVYLEERIQKMVRIHVIDGQIRILSMLGLYLNRLLNFLSA